MRATPKRLRSAVLILVAALVVGWLGWWRPVNGADGPVPRDIGDGWLLSSPAAEGFNAGALQRSARALLDGGLNVHAVLVERHGRLVLESYRGGRDHSVYGLVGIRRSFGPLSRHDMRSIGKSVTALLYGIALAHGEVPDPSRPLSEAFPALGGIAASNARAIHVGDLLDMDSGLAWNEEAPGVNDELRLFWRRDLPGYVLDRPRATTPGTRFNYNGGGTALLALLIAEGSHRPLDRFAREHLFSPLGITDVEWVTDLHGRPMPFNGLRLRPRDLLKIGQLVLRHGDWHGRSIVPPAWVDGLWSPGLPTGVADFRYRGQWWQGTVAWHGRRLPWRAAFGNGGQRLFVIPELDVAIVTTAGAYDALPTAIAVNRFAQQVADAIVD